MQSKFTMLLELLPMPTQLIGTLLDVFYKLPEINPFVFLIALIGILVLFFYKKINQKFIRVIPAPMWVLLLALPVVFGFDFFNEHSISFLGNTYGGWS